MIYLGQGLGYVPVFVNQSNLKLWQAEFVMTSNLHTSDVNNQNYKGGITVLKKMLNWSFPSHSYIVTEWENGLCIYLSFSKIVNPIFKVCG